MAWIEVNGTRLYYEVAGEGTETIVFSHGLLWSGRMFEAQIRHLSPRYRCIAYDHRGQGQSPDSPTPFDLETLYEDAVQLIERLCSEPCHFVGLSMGGFIGMRIAARRPELLRSLILLNTSAQAEHSTLRYALLNALAGLFGVRSVIGPVMKVLFGKSFLENPNNASIVQRWQSQLAANRRSITRSVCAVIYRKPVLGELSRVKVPVLILAGEEDVATPPKQAEAIHRAIPSSKLVVLARAGHSLPIEAPEEVNSHIASFLASWKKDPS